MKKLFKAIVNTSLIFTLFSTSAFAVSGKVTGSKVRIRKEPDTKSIEVSVATENEVVDIIGDEGNWYKVNFENVTGYISKDYVDTDYVSGSSNLTETDEENSSSTQTETPTISEETPEIKPEETPEPENNTTEQTSSEENPNNEVETPVSDEPIETPSAPETQEPPQNQVDYQKNQTVTFSNDTDLKYLPSFTSRNSCKASSGSEYTIEDILNKWVKVSNDTNSGWVLKVNIENKTPESTPEPTPEETPNSTQEPETYTTTKKGVVNVESARIRKSPDGEALSSIKEGTEVTILGEEDDWYHISVEDYDSCYIAKRLITEK